MARRKRIEINAEKLSVFAGIIEELKSIDDFKDIDTSTITISALEQYEPRISNLQTICDRLENYISINGNKRVTKKDLCRIIKISRPTLDKWERDNLIVLDFLCGSKELLIEWHNRLLKENILYAARGKSFAHCYGCNYAGSEDIKLNMFVENPEVNVEIFNNCFNNPKEYSEHWKACNVVQSYNQQATNHMRKQLKYYKGNFGIDLSAFLSQLKKNAVNY